MSDTVKVGDAAPDFSSVDQSGEAIHLAQFKGKCVVLYFYPKDFTFGCTKQACAFRDNYEALSAHGAVLIGVSRDDTESHKGFVDKYKLPFYLISDSEGKISQSYGVGSSFFGMVPGRTTYVIDHKGIVRDIFSSQLRWNSHVSNACEALERIHAEQQSASDGGEADSSEGKKKKKKKNKKADDTHKDDAAPEKAKEELSEKESDASASAEQKAEETEEAEEKEKEAEKEEKKNKKKKKKSAKKDESSGSAEEAADSSIGTSPTHLQERGRDVPHKHKKKTWK
eukprot:TRINITY_DN7718_c0_g1_i1.p1 TRINITY_DN7718_c0_g1~~TRINITY_DN7718_c0_g1_i1.p1  ORF type:complete len:283 (+),score=83.55 TRINITY_DN7718_c0_g1_i1:36-884(+)